MRPPLVGLSGYAGAGKDSVGAALVENHGYTRVAFADKLKELLEAINPAVSSPDNSSAPPVWKFLPLNSVLQTSDGWDGAKKHASVRTLLQKTGEGVRNVLGPDTWVRSALPAPEDRTSPIVVTDVRYWNEALEIQRQGGVVIRLSRPGIGPANDHRSEVDLDHFPFDAVYRNEKGVSYIPEIAAQIARKAAVARNQ